MPAEVKILVEGYTNADKIVEAGEERNCPTIVLVRDKGLVMVIDPGVLETQQILIDALEKEDLTPEDVDVVCITHSHIDHYRNIGMFPRAKILEYYGFWDKDRVGKWPEKFTPNIQILYTPGHDVTSITVFVETAIDSEYPGVVAICGDIFWKENYPQNSKDDIFASDKQKLQDSRDLVLRMADWIIPGHGGIYKNERNDIPAREEKIIVEQKKGSKILICKKCEATMKQTEKCQCRPHLCFRCCECGFDCPACGCSHKR